MTINWTHLGACSTCGVGVGQPCIATGDRYSLLWPPQIKRPHRERATRSAPRFTTKELRALRVFERPRGKRSYRNVHANSIHALQRKGLITSTHRLTAVGREALRVPNIFDSLFTD